LKGRRQDRRGGTQLARTKEASEERARKEDGEWGRDDERADVPGEHERLQVGPRGFVRRPGHACPRLFLPSVQIHQLHVGVRAATKQRADQRRRSVLCSLQMGTDHRVLDVHDGRDDMFHDFVLHITVASRDELPFIAGVIPPNALINPPQKKLTIVCVWGASDG